VAAFRDRKGLASGRLRVVEGVMNQVRRRKQDEKDEQKGGEKRKIPARCGFQAPHCPGCYQIRRLHVKSPSMNFSVDFLRGLAILCPCVTKTEITKIISHAALLLLSRPARAEKPSGDANLDGGASNKGAKR
jgi:hypothetical protein